jgi:hypothetical protein
VISAEQHERERAVAERLMRPQPMAAMYAGRCACGARWQPGDVIWRSRYRRGIRPTCLDCGLRAAEASK